MEKTEFCIKTIKHACYSQETLFDVVQNDYIGSPTGYLEILTINDPPIGKHQFIVHNAINYAQEGRFVELNSLEEAIKIFEMARSCIYPNWYKSPEIITCSFYNDSETPWFYSKTKDFSETTFVVPS